ncbi:MAG: ribosome-recycling factor [Candidatus Pacebacteria bacterium]|nr:ribosome-recycling factor [Candidatus Paceibacterota bacterium]MCD8563985.1 ribosome-recycling factor [Candidatus Paceibacterota bacterium]
MSYNFQETKDTLAHIEEWLRKEYSQISTGRANPILLDSIMIDSYGSKQPVKNVAAIHTEDARTLRIAPWDKSQIKDIERALTDSKLPFSIAVDSDGLRLHIPQLTEESKKSLVKLVKEKLEEARVRIRGERNRVEKDLDQQKKDGTMGEDDVFRTKEALQKLIDTANTTLEEIFNLKEKDIMN